MYSAWKLIMRCRLLPLHGIERENLQVNMTSVTDDGKTVGCRQMASSSV